MLLCLFLNKPNFRVNDDLTILHASSHSSFSSFYIIYTTNIHTQQYYCSIHFIPKPYSLIQLQQQQQQQQLHSSSFMALPCTSTSSTFSSSMMVLLFMVVLLSLVSSHGGCCYGLNTFGFDIHHRHSDPVMEILGSDGGVVPHIGTPQYYAAMAHRDQIFSRRKLAAGDHLTFAAGNDTIQGSQAFGLLKKCAGPMSKTHVDLSLHFANVSVGTPPLSFLVALDTGSDLFWLPCNCTSCVHGIKKSNRTIDFNIYELDQSSTSKRVFCNSSLCGEQRKCPSSGSTCRYEVDYLSNGTSSLGLLVEDVLHLVTDDNQTKDVDTRITLGCGQVQTGAFLDGAAPNGLFGLGMENISVPSILAKQGLTSNSFSMCFGSDGYGRITFGDSGSSDQRKTPFNVRALHPMYNITVTQVIVGGNAADLEFYAIFDSGTSYTSLNDPAYTLIAEKFNSLIKVPRHSSQSSNSGLPFDYCYDISSNGTVEVPYLNLTMKGGDDYYVMNPIVPVSSELEGVFVCLAIVKSDSVNIIGQNFMTGYRIVFDRDNMNLGWKESDCYGNVLTYTSPTPTNKSQPPAVSPAVAVNPVVSSDPSSSSSGTLSPSSSSFRMRPTFAFMMIVLFLVLTIF